ncbi:MAG: acyltransferase [Bacteroidota bacterium]
MTNTSKARFQSLTGVRFIAVCLVFIYHNRKYWRDSLHPEVIRLFNEFHVGVSLFFVLSGFLIAYTYEDKPLQSASAYCKYFLVRCARILPLYWLILTLYYLDKHYGNFQFSLLTYSLFHGFSDAHNLDGIAQAWSLTVEMTFYILAPVLFFIKRKNLWLLLIILVSLFALFWGIGAIWQYWNTNQQRFFMPIQFLLLNSFAGRSSEFLAGMILASVVQKNAGWLQKLPFKTIIGFSWMFLTIYAIGWFQKDIYDHGYTHSIGMLISKTALPLSMALVLAGLIYEDTWLNKTLGSKLLVLLGNASFAFYLVHISYVNLKIKDWYTFPDRNFIILWIISIVLYKYFESPIYHLCKKLLKTKKVEN